MRVAAYVGTDDYADGNKAGGMKVSVADLPTLSRRLMPLCMNNMYSMAREHMPSKLELAKVGAAATLVGYIDHEVKQCRLNATAALSLALTLAQTRTLTLALTPTLTLTLTR